MEHKTKIKILLILIICLTVGIIISIFSFGAGFRNYDVQMIHFNNDRGDIVEGILYLPRIKGDSGKTGFPALISIHYGIQNREALQPVAKMTAGNGIIVLDLILKKSRHVDGKIKDFQDYLSDARGAVEYLLSHNRVDPSRIFISGHSIGANLASLAGGGNRDIAGVIAVGYPIVFEGNMKQGLLMTAGVFDELHPLGKMLAAYNETLGTETKDLIFLNPGEIGPGISPGKPARLYYISFLSDHYIEPTDPDIAAASVEFIRTMEDGGAGEWAKKPLEGLSGFILGILARLLLFWGVFFLFCAGFVEIISRHPLEKLVPSWLSDRFLTVITALYIILIGLVHRPSEHLIDIYILSPILLSLLSVNFFRRKMAEREKVTGVDGTSLKRQANLTLVFFRGAFKIGLVVGIFYISYLSGLFLHAGIAPYSRISTLWRTLTGVVYMVPAQVFVFCSRVNGLFLNPDWSFNFLSPVMIGILLLELIYPGGVGMVLDQFFSRVIAALQNLDFKIKFQVSLPAAGLLILVLIACFFLWRQILAEGYALGSKEILGLAYLFLSFIMLPAGIVTGLLRWGRVRKILKSLSG